jgi:hypothetical protein
MEQQNPTNNNYETPELQLVGSANDVILGMAWFGDDVDGFYVPRRAQWNDN